MKLFHICEMPELFCEQGMRNTNLDCGQKGKPIAQIIYVRRVNRTAKIVKKGEILCYHFKQQSSYIIKYFVGKLIRN